MILPIENKINLYQSKQMVKTIIAFLSLVFCICCARLSNQEQPTPQILATLQERDLIPEGTAFDPVTEQVFISSMYKRKIVAIRKDGSHYEFVKEAADGIWATLGMEVDPARRRLWVISSKGDAGILTQTKIGDETWDSQLFCYDLDSASLIRKYAVLASVPKGYCFNDLTVSSNGDVYITESLTNKIFFLQHDADSIKVLFEPSGYTFLNGITLTRDEKSLIVSSTESLLRINLATKSITLLPYTAPIKQRPIDGLTYYNNSLIGHQSNILTRFYLNEQQDSIINYQIIDTSGLDSSTTGEIGEDGWYYYIANSQIRSGIDYNKMTIMPMDSLEPIVIKKLRL
jgi:DNA-binding beta-propeller fold protein YncE